MKQILKYLRRYFYDGRHRDPENRRADSMVSIVHWPRHLSKRGETTYRKAGAVHWGDWYDEPTGAYQTILPVGMWT
jgi:hypothetical protein